MFLVFMVMVVTGMSSGMGEHHNREEHATLCNLLGAAASLWDRVKDLDQTSPLKKALGQVIFGTQAGGDLDALKKGFPGEYTNGSRGYSCGECKYTSAPYPGMSIPHDLLCLCTMGKHGAPFNSHGIHSLCGATGGDWDCKEYRADLTYAGKGIHWDCQNKTQWSTGWDHGRLNTTWHKVVQQCLSQRPKTRLLTALATFKDMKEKNPFLNWGAYHKNCGGDGYGSLCVGSSGWCGRKNGFPQWLEALEDLTQEDFNAIRKSRNRRRTRRQARGGTSSSQPDEEDYAEDEDDEFGMSTEDGSTTPNPDKARLLSHVSNHDSTLLTPPFLWPLGALVAWL